MNNRRRRTYFLFSSNKLLPLFLFEVIVCLGTPLVVISRTKSTTPSVLDDQPVHPLIQIMSVHFLGQWKRCLPYWIRIFFDQKNLSQQRVVSIMSLAANTDVMTNEKEKGLDPFLFDPSSVLRFARRTFLHFSLTVDVDKTIEIGNTLFLMTFTISLFLLFICNVKFCMWNPQFAKRKILTTYSVNITRR